MIDTNKEAFAEGLAELILIDCNSITKTPLYHLFSNQESAESDPSLERKNLPAGENLKKKIIKTILNYMDNE